MEIWINPACSKCRAATTAFDEAGIDYTVRRYLDDPPTAEELTAVLTRLNLEPWDIVRHNESAAKPLKALPRDADHRSEWIEAMATNPILIQRPIITADDRTTAVARDPETLRKFLP
ncbi:arsenate reductase [Kribbella sp. VKM Ac-2571]|uniref:ArsC/Spx/MgsR family protein n=1 Tax=Kribbella sp. VKM Ac-2571 TaxID=2512222 RepID=UPI00106108DA|nr:ArsC/Spx/MgsR family protein [Kribbella sp. VKM Ac-2571]TDO62753.1 arsenate reductase [Kribbella sp. VKM Ac-2571]